MLSYAHAPGQPHTHARNQDAQSKNAEHNHDAVARKCNNLRDFDRVLRTRNGHNRAHILTAQHTTRR